MFGNLGFNEMVVIFAIALVVFGPRRLPEIARSMGHALHRFRQAAGQVRETIEREVEVDRLRSAVSDLRDAARAGSEAPAASSAPAAAPEGPDGTEPRARAATPAPAAAASVETEPGAEPAAPGSGAPAPLRS